MYDKMLAISSYPLFLIRCTAFPIHDSLRLTNQVMWLQVASKPFAP